MYPYMYIHIYQIYNICTYVCTDYVKHMSLPRTPSRSKEFELPVLSVSLSHSPPLARAHPLSMLQCPVSLSLQFMLVFLSYSLQFLLVFLLSVPLSLSRPHCRGGHCSGHTQHNQGHAPHHQPTPM